MKYSVGDLIIYRKEKFSPNPTLRAKYVHPSSSGEEYHYAVDKYWAISKIIDRNTVEAVTRTGKKHRLRVDDPRLHKAGLWDKIMHRDRFPDPDVGDGNNSLNNNHLHFTAQ